MLSTCDGLKLQVLSFFFFFGGRYSIQVLWTHVNTENIWNSRILKVPRSISSTVDIVYSIKQMDGLGYTYSNPVLPPLRSLEVRASECRVFLDEK